MVSKDEISQNSFVLFVDDGSSDNTFEILKNFKVECCKIIRLTRNMGHQYALLAGIHYVTGKVDCAISIDADLQDDLNVIGLMVNEYKNGAHIVCGVRDDRGTDRVFKKLSAKMFYKIMKLFGVYLVENHADFRLLSNAALNEIGKYKETNLFLRGLFPLINLKLKTISYSQGIRRFGQSKYSFRKMVSLALKGITSFSSTPIRIITILGIFFFVVTMILSIHVLYVYLIGRTVPGWASITLPMYFLGGIQLLSLGIIGEYISNIYKETKRRPMYHVESILD